VASSPIAVLLGSGFSIPEGLPSVAAINAKLRQIKESDFYLFSDQTAGFYHSDWKDANGWMPSVFLDRSFTQKFTEFYVSKYLGGQLELFNYEVYYDFIMDFLRFKTNEEEINAFCQSFQAEFKGTYLSQNALNWLSRLLRILNQLIADLLFVPRYYSDVGYTNYPTYGAFFGCLIHCSKSHVVNVHTLNHDLFFEGVAGRLSGLYQHYCDGYTEYGSRYFGTVPADFKTDRGEVHKEYKVRLQYYTGNYEKPLRLFKLHGSIDSYILRTDQRDAELRVKRDFRVTDFSLERFDESSKSYRYEKPFTDTFPDFLSGTTEKIRKYNLPFYDSLLSHLKENLMSASNLVIIGYGFQDKGINDYIEKYYLIYRKPLSIVDLREVDAPFLQPYKAGITWYLNGVSSHSYTEYLKMFGVPENNS
jgi:hypothetical protein